MSEKCVHEWYYRIVDIVSWQFFCIRCGEKLSMDKFSDRATELEKNADALNTRIAELEAERRWVPVSERSPEDGEVVWLWDGNNLGMGYYLVLAGQFMDRDTPLRQIKPTHWMPLPQPPEVQQ